MLAPSDEPLSYHAARLLILILRCGKPRSDPSLRPAIEGRTLLAKLDFFLRYPAYLQKASVILNRPLREPDLGVATATESNTVESHMVRYLYGPWDHIYYTVLAY